MKIDSISLFKRLKQYIHDTFSTQNNSSVKFVFVGKGGVGKTTLCALMATALDQEGYKVLAIDANPDAHLAQSFGIENSRYLADEYFFMHAIVDGHDCVSNHVLIPNDFIDNIIQRFGMSWGKQSDLLSLGWRKSSTDSSLLTEKNILWSIIRSASKEKYDVVLIDTEAGFESFRQGFNIDIDILVTMTQPTHRSIEMARNVKFLTQSVGIEHIVHVLSSYQSELEATNAEEKLGENIAFKIPYLESIRQSSLDGTIVSIEPLWQESIKEFALGLYENAVKKVA